MELTASKKSSVGFTIGMTGLATMIGVGATRGFGAAHYKVAIASALISFLGLAAWMMGRHQPSPPPATGASIEGDAPEELQAGAFGFLKLPMYWGTVVCVSALLLGIYSSIEIYRQRPKPARPVDPPPIQHPAVVLPALTVQGLVQDGDNSSALINGRVLRLGEKIEGVQLVKVEPTGVWVEFEGQHHQLKLKD